MASIEFEPEASGSQESVIVNMEENCITSLPVHDRFSSSYVNQITCPIEHKERSSVIKKSQLPDDGRDMEVVEKFMSSLQKAADEVEAERQQKRLLDQIKHLTRRDECDLENEKLLNRVLQTEVYHLTKRVQIAEAEAYSYKVNFPLILVSF
jgi:hypothetical protein